MTVIAFEVLTASHGSSISGPNPGLDFDLADPVAPNISLTDRSVLSPNVVRYLLGRYGTCFAPRYNLLEPELLTNDGVSFKKLEDVAKAKILLACAAAAAHEAYRMPSWRSVAQICRDWADELLTPVLAPGNKDAVTMTVMLLVFELAEPSRGLAWDLLNLATRMCLQLGWLHRPQLSDLASSSTATASEEQIYHGGPSDQENLVATLRDIDRYVNAYTVGFNSITKMIPHRTLQGVFYRPSMLNTPKQLAIGVRVIQDQTMIFGIRAQIYEEIYGQGRVFENRACPFVGELATLLHALESLQNDQSHLMLLEALLLLLPVCVKHKQCISCFQEPDELPETRGMRSLRLRVSEAAAQIISTVHETTVAAGKFTPPFAACVSVFSAGCCLVTAAAKGWTPLRAHTKDILNCTEVLTLFSMQWKGGRRYLHVWRTLTALLDFT